jgi:hypothetical protein
MPDLVMDEHGGEPQAVSRRAFLSTGAAGIGAAALVPGAPDASVQTDRPEKDAAMSLSRELAVFVASLRYKGLPPDVVDRTKAATLETLASAAAAPCAKADALLAVAMARPGTPGGATRTRRPSQFVKGFA